MFYFLHLNKSEGKEVKTDLGRILNPQLSHLYTGDPSSQPATTCRGGRTANHDTYESNVD